MDLHGARRAARVVARPSRWVTRGIGAVGASAAIAWFSLTGGTLLLPALGASEPAPAPASSQCTGGALQLVAHEDDDLLFLSPDVLHDVQAGRCVRTVYLSAGDAARGDDYWLAREKGSQAAYAEMAGVDDLWTVTDLAVSGQVLRLATLTDAPQISLVFMRLPDGNRRGTGMRVHDHESLMRLWQGDIATVHALDGSASYTATTLTASLTRLMTDFAPTTVRTQDWTIPFRHGDNADHTATALFTRVADRGYDGPHTLLAYEGYPAWTKLPDVSGVDLEAKSRALLAYSADDSRMCLRLWCQNALVSSLRVGRQYVTASESRGNVARETGVVVTASSETAGTGQGASAVVDGLSQGWPVAPSDEWRSDGDPVGQWVQITLPEPRRVTTVVLADRPNLDDQVTSARLELSDGTTIDVGPLPNNGSAVTVEIPPRATTTVRVVITGVSTTTRDVGLAELEVYGADAP